MGFEAEKKLFAGPFEKTQMVRHGMHLGIKWAVCIGGMAYGANGYVQIPKEHPWAKVACYDDVPIDAHGGLTYGWKEFHPVPLPEGMENVPNLFTEEWAKKMSKAYEDVDGWVGFDTAHYGDAPMSQEERAANGISPMDSMVWASFQRTGPFERSWTINEVAVECIDMCEQVDRNWNWKEEEEAGGAGNSD